MLDAAVMDWVYPALTTAGISHSKLYKSWISGVIKFSSSYFEEEE